MPKSGLGCCSRKRARARMHVEGCFTIASMCVNRARARRRCPRPSTCGVAPAWERARRSAS
eukprot:4004333-Pleurochrysis_carterae.AAC.1